MKMVEAEALWVFEGVQHLPHLGHIQSPLLHSPLLAPPESYAPSNLADPLVRRVLLGMMAPSEPSLPFYPTETGCLIPVLHLQ